VDAPWLNLASVSLGTTDQGSQVSGLVVAATHGGGPLWRYAIRVPITYAAYFWPRAYSGYSSSIS
ncbi:MAG: hypothetical protein ABJM82_15855, partial [Shimia thalassica]|uniref:hypothetical protein n=1 Tax=Shimia thalassica TaxID=1715693 RepID=UPI0032981620